MAGEIVLSNRKSELDRRYKDGGNTCMARKERGAELKGIRVRKTGLKTQDRRSNYTGTIKINQIALVLHSHFTLESSRLILLLNPKAVQSSSNRCTCFVPSLVWIQNESVLHYWGPFNNEGFSSRFRFVVDHQHLTWMRQRCLCSPAWLAASCITQPHQIL